MKKTVIIHVGPPKTGTSVLQYWLNEYRVLLSENSIFYPAHDIDANKVSSGHRALFLNKNADGNMRFDHDKFKALLSNFFISDCNTLVLSSEFFFYQIPEFLTYKDEVNLKFIAYVRPDIDVVESLYNQSVKRNRQTEIIAQRKSLPKIYSNKILDYIEEYDAGFFSLRAYSFMGRNIIIDFFDALGINSDRIDINNVGYVNSSYSFECLEFKRWLNKFNLEKFDNLIDQYLQAYSSATRKYTLLPQPVYEGYLEQSIDRLEKLNFRSPIYSYSEIIESLENKVRPQYMHQELNDIHLIRVCRFLNEKDSTLLKRILKVLECAELDDLDRQRVNLIKEDFFSDQQASFFAKMKLYFRSLFSFF